jgi:predicted phosphodiesterase
MLGVLYDIHGNMPALEPVLEEAQAVGVDRWLLGGDYGTPSPWPLETLDRLRKLEPATWIRGNGERWLRDPPLDRPEVMQVYELFTGGLPDSVVEWLYGLPPQAELDGVLYVHGSPLADDDSFAPQPQEGEQRLLAGVHDRLVVFGHSHQQFRRPGPENTELLNPGSVGMPWDGDHRAAYAVIDGDRVECRRVEYDWEGSVAAVRDRVGELPARRMELARFDVS